MDWLEIGSWIAAALLLAGLQVWTRKARVPKPFGVFAGAVIGALVGGVFAHIVLFQPLAVDGYSVWALVAALVAAEVSILMSLAIRSGQRPPLAGT